MMSYFILYSIHIVISFILMKFYDPKSFFLLPIVFAISIMYIPILFINPFLKGTKNYFLKDFCYIILGVILFIVFIYSIHGKIDKTLFCSFMSIITLYSFILYMLLHMIINQYIKR